MDETLARLVADTKTLEILHLIRAALNNRFKESLDKYRLLAEKSGLSMDDPNIVEHCELFAARDTLVDINGSLQLDIELTSAVLESYDHPRH